MDAVAEFYSKPQAGGSIRTHSYRKGSTPRYAIPLNRGAGGREYVGKAAGGIAEAVKMAGSEAVKSFERDSVKSDEDRKFAGVSGAGKSQQRFVKNSAGGMIARSMDEDDKGKRFKRKNNSNKKKKHKRSKIDELLGDNSY